MLIVAGSLLLFSSAHAAKKKAAPPSTVFFPAGAQRGTTSTITLSGKLEDCHIAIDCPGVMFVPGEKNSVDVIVAPDAPLGLHLVQVFNESGASDPRWFSIGALPEILEKEPNDSLGAEQVIDKLPMCVNGQLEKRGTADLFAFKLEAGQTLVAALEAYALGSLVDPLLELRDEQRTILATAHDGRNLDPVLSFKAPKTGRYTLQVAGFTHPPAADVNFAGGPGIVYRLSLSTQATTLRVFPAAVSRTSPNKLDLLGANIADKSKTFDFDASHLAVEPRISTITPPFALAPIQVAVTDAAVQRATEPNSTSEQAMPLTVPACVGGRIDKAGDADCFAFEAKKGSYYNLRLLAKSLGLPLDAVLTVMDPTGKEAASNDDTAEGEDPLLSFKASVDGRHIIKVTDLFGKGGEDAEYVLILGPGEETFSATITTKPTLVVEAGKTVEIKAKIKRVGGYAGDLVARVHGLPVGVICADVEAPKKSGDEFTLKLQAAQNAASSNGPISAVLWTKEAKDKPLLSRAATLDLRGENRRGTTTLDVTDRLWLTVIAEPAKAVTKP